MNTAEKKTMTMKNKLLAAFLKEEKVKTVFSIHAAIDFQGFSVDSLVASHKLRLPMKLIVYVLLVVMNENRSVKWESRPT